MVEGVRDGGCRQLQDVPISIQALSTQTLEQHQVSSFDDYQKLLPSVSSQSFGPGQAQLYFRGITSGADGLHGGSLPATVKCSSGTVASTAITIPTAAVWLPRRAPRGPLSCFKPRMNKTAASR